MTVLKECRKCHRLLNPIMFKPRKRQCRGCEKKTNEEKGKL